MVFYISKISWTSVTKPPSLEYGVLVLPAPCIMAEECNGRHFKIIRHMNAWVSTRKQFSTAISMRTDNCDNVTLRKIDGCSILHDPCS